MLEDSQNYSNREHVMALRGLFLTLKNDLIDLEQTCLSSVRLVSLETQKLVTKVKCKTKNVTQGKAML